MKFYFEINLFFIRITIKKKEFLLDIKLFDIKNDDDCKNPIFIT